LTWLQEGAFGLLKRRPVLTRYRLTSSQKSVTYDSRKIMSRLGWKAPVPLAAALDSVVSAEMSRQSAEANAASPVRDSRAA
jgi:hypothetical protein